MKKNKLLAALTVCTLAAMPAVMADISITENISGGSSLYGGAINNELGDTVNVSDGVIFSNNASTYQYQGGGAIYNQNQGVVNIGDNVQFNNNSINNNSDAASAGGAIANWGSGTINIGDNVKFEGNGSNESSGWSCGGAIYSDSDRYTQSNLTIKSNGKFYGNKTGYGGAMYLEGTNAVIGSSEFKNNEAQRGSGGAVSITGGKLGHVDSNGVAQDYPIVKSTVNFTGKNIFFKNSAKTDGGAIRVNGDSTVSIDSSSVFEANSASGNGGAIANTGYYEDEPYVPTPAKEEYISTVTANGVSFVNNSAKGNGGAIYNALVSSLETTNEQKQKDAVFNASGVFTGNSAAKGGAIYNNGTFTLGSSEFTDNKAQQGGAIYNAEAGVLNMSGVTVNAASANAANDVYNEGRIELTDKNVINSNLSGNGIINNNGELILGGNNSKFTGEYNTIADSITTVTGTYLGGDREFSAGTLNWYTSQEDALSGYLQITGGKLNIGNKDSEIYAVLNIDKDSRIDADVQTNLAEGSVLNIQNGGKVELNSDDTWDGTIILGANGAADSSTTLDVSGLDKTGTLLANNGVLLLGDKDLDIQGESYIEKAVAMELGGNIKVSNGGRVAIDDNDKMTGSAPTVTLSEGGTLNYGKTVDSDLVIKADAGNLNLLAGSNLTFKEGSIADPVAIDIQEKANLKLAGSTLNLDSADQWNGNIINDGGTINANNLTKSSNTATLTQSDGELNLYNDSNLVLGTESLINGGNITIKKDDIGSNGSVLTVYGEGDKEVISAGDMTIDEYSKFVLGSGKFTIDTLSATAVQNPDGTIQAALVDVMNGEISESKIGSIILATGDDKISQANFNIDVLARSNKRKDNDTFIINTIADDATVYVNQWGLGGDIYGWDAPIDRHIKLNDIFLDKNGNDLLNNIEVTKETTFTPIGWYQLNKNEEYENIIDPATGLPVIDPVTGMIKKNHVGSNYTLDLVKYNPQVFRGQVATVAQWMNQLNIDDMLFTHSMVLPSFKDPEGGTMANRYAAESPLFAPYQYSRKDGGLWYKMYGTFENLQMNNGLSRVGNNAYGALIGADFGLKDLKNGWKFMPTAYVGYNGAHQTFAHMGQYQNGGQAGFLGTWYKDNIILGALAYGGIYDNSMDVHGFNDSTFNYFAGAATKASYNIRLHRDWVLQPNLFVAYNYFGQQNWHSRFGQMGMMAGQLNGVNIAPGLNLIWEKETFSAYATLQYMYNINGACGGRAGNVDLPKMEMDRGYIQYGLGINKKFTNRASGYLQAVLRNVGRTGVGFQAGFNYMIGK